MYIKKDHSLNRKQLNSSQCNLNKVTLSKNHPVAHTIIRIKYFISII